MTCLNEDLASIPNNSKKKKRNVFSSNKFFVHNCLSGKTEKPPAGVGLVAISVSDNGYQIVPPEAH